MLMNLFRCHWIACSLIFCLGGAVNADQPVSSEDPRAQEILTKRLPLGIAKERAELLHEVYHATLETLHDRYFHGDRAPVPARTMETIFREIEKKSDTKTRWISASLKAMSIDHEPQTPFEKKAAQMIAEGVVEIETIEDGYYRRAGQIPLTGGCISCHAGVFSNATPSRKFAGLIISIPVIEDGERLSEIQEPTQDKVE